MSCPRCYRRSSSEEQEEEQTAVTTTTTKLSSSCSSCLVLQEKLRKTSELRVSSDATSHGHPHLFCVWYLRSRRGSTNLTAVVRTLSSGDSHHRLLAVFFPNGEVQLAVIHTKKGAVSTGIATTTNDGDDDGVGKGIFDPGKLTRRLTNDAFDYRPTHADCGEVFRRRQEEEEEERGSVAVSFVDLTAWLRALEGHCKHRLLVRHFDNERKRSCAGPSSFATLSVQISLLAKEKAEKEKNLQLQQHRRDVGVGSGRGSGSDSGGDDARIGRSFPFLASAALLIIVVVVVVVAALVASPRFWR